MLTAISTALSGMNADTTAISIIGNDLANLNTTGYKSNELEFHDLVAQSLGITESSGQVGLGVGQVSSVTNFAQGSLQTTNGPTDVAIQGDGFFVVKDHSGNNLYTRDGSFQINANGNLVTSTGDLVQGWSSTVSGAAVNTNGAIGNLTVPLGATIPASATTTMNLAINLNSSASTTGTDSSFAVPVQVVDSQGTSHTLTATFSKTAANAWSYALTVPTTDVKSGSGSVATGTLTFGSNGLLTNPTASNDPQAVKVTGLADGASDLSINWNLYDSSGNSTITQFAEASAVSGTTQNGFTAGQISKISLQNGGTMVANYSNGQQVTIGQLALATVSNPESLISVGNNNLQASATTGQPAIGTANTGARGNIVGGAIESSTVDIATEFTQLLTVQRSYQANSRVITTGDQMVQDTLNLIHP